MRRRVRGFSTRPSRSHRSADRSTPHSPMLGPLGIADSPNQESAPAGHEETPHPTSSLGHLLPREKAEVIFPLRGERVAAMRRRVRGFSTLPSRSHRSADRSTPHSPMLGPFGIADSPNQESAPAGVPLPYPKSRHPTPVSRVPYPVPRIPCPVSLIPRKDFLWPSSNKP